MLAHVEDPVSERLEYLATSVVDLWFASDHNRERPFSSAQDTTADWGVEHVDPSRRKPLRDAPRRRRLRTGRVDQGLAAGEPICQSALTEDDLLDNI